MQGDYEIAFRTVLRFVDGRELPIRAKLFGENSQKVVVRDVAGKPAALSGYTQGRSEILDPDGNVIFEGRYYDTRTYQALTGDDALTRPASAFAIIGSMGSEGAFTPVTPSRLAST